MKKVTRIECLECKEVFSNKKSFSNHYRHHYKGFTERWLYTKGKTPRKPLTTKQRKNISVAKRKDIITNPDSSRQRARYDYGYKPCDICGDEESEIHHINGNPFDNCFSNISHLCRRHHMIIDGRMAKLVKRLKERGIAK